MTTTDWIIIAAALVGGIVAGVIASRVVMSVLGAPSRPEPLQKAAKALASLAMSVFVVIGLIIALGVVSPSALDQLPKDLIDFLPRLLSAAILVIIANVAASFATAAVGPALARLPAGAQRQTLALVKGTILGLGILLAVRQLGFDTTVINIAIAAVLFGASGALMLLVALGGRHVASEVASTRVLRRMLDDGDHIRTGDTEGTVVALHPTAIELTTQAGETILVPSSRFIVDTVTILRSKRPTPPPSDDA